MPYATLDNIQDQVSENDLISLTDDEDAGSINTDIVDAAITAAMATIDAYCKKQYVVPFPDPAPELITMLCVDITIYRLYKRRLGPNESVRNSYQDAISTLKDISKGNVKVTDDDPDTTDSEVGIFFFESNTRVFTRDSLSGW